MSQKEAQT